MIKKIMKNTEHQEQVAVIQWCYLNRKKHIELQLLYAIPNGGKRSISEAVKFKAEGVKSGVPDLCLPVPRHGFGSLYIEMKVKGGKVSEHQKEWHKALEHVGNKVVVCWSAEEAIEELKRYIIE